MGEIRLLLHRLSTNQRQHLEIRDQIPVLSPPQRWPMDMFLVARVNKEESTLAVLQVMKNFSIRLMLLRPFSMAHRLPHRKRGFDKW